jgi:iron complex outermembrane receptor protein
MAQLSSENTILATETKKIKINGGLSTNLRQENEGGGGISLSMLLNAGNVVWQTTRLISGTNELTFGASGFAQTNTNYGGRVIVPDARSAEVSGFGFYKRNLTHWLLEGGLRIDQRWLSTFQTLQLNAGTNGPGLGTSILPFSRSWQAMNASAGSTFRAAQWLSFRGSVSTGFRPGNLAELSSNGLHEGSLRWEIGLPIAKIEQNLNGEFSLLMKSKFLNASASVYRNHFWNYIYLAPTGLEYFGFKIYHFQQTDATLKGGELQLDWTLPGTPLEMQSSFSLISAKKGDGNYLPFISANKLAHDFKFHLQPAGNVTHAVIRLGGAYSLAQQHPAEFETQTPAYFLLNAGATLTIKKMDFALSGNNLLNKVYYDHLSRFKYYGIYNMGRNVVLSVYFKF